MSANHLASSSYDAEVLKSIRRNRIKQLKEKNKNRKAVVSTNKNINYLMFYIPVLCYALFLFFSSGGVFDYFNNQRLLKDRGHYYEALISQKDNMIKTIEKFKVNQQFQKKLIRNQLGYVNEQEYLILFAGD